MKRHLFWPEEGRTTDFIDVEHPDFEKVWEGDNPYEISHMIHGFFALWDDKIALCFLSLAHLYSDGPFEIQPVHHTDLLRLRLNLITGQQLVDDFPDTASWGHDVYLKSLQIEYCCLQGLLDSAD
ncbi:MAG: hypothetical protein KKH88_00240 [Nanoarchaeota archaeon]|nr:hypothetical protein [Nanoarchaeota archaeon]MBU1445463.1 hypothetical protein [Nanoarchaeota archaeon]MBU2406680.1 hypothetical protein [Nanoarchaeota archaeon]MBU2420663.1 hypothetical protein [Nanoarchaeota archaeon]MBU2475400.1 hypothetical protein [Nanoarchaeota archaeon]